MLSSGEAGSMWPAIALLSPGGDSGGDGPETITAPTDLGEWRDSYVVQMDVPGFTETDVDVSVSGTTVHVRTGRRGQQPLQEATFYHHERDRRPVEQELELPMSVDEQATTATVDDGVLTLLLPKDFEQETD